MAKDPAKVGVMDQLASVGARGNYESTQLRVLQTLGGIAETLHSIHGIMEQQSGPVGDARPDLDSIAEVRESLRVVTQQRDEVTDNLRRHMEMIAAVKGVIEKLGVYGDDGFARAVDVRSDLQAAIE
ncbi:MAG: hypothetical protein ACTMIR_07530 [Cellulomonadaceae bacterium]